MDGVDHHPFKITVIGNGAALLAAGKYHSCRVLNGQGGLYLTDFYRKIYENAGLEVWTVPLEHRLPSTGYLFREKKAGLNIRKDALPRYSLTIDEILAVKSGSDLWRDGVRIPNEALTYLPILPRSYAYCTDTVFSPDVARWSGRRRLYRNGIEIGNRTNRKY